MILNQISNASTSVMCNETDFCNKSDLFNSEKPLFIFAIIFLLFITWVFNCCNICSSASIQRTNSDVLIDNDKV
jgi:hypothetical protein